MCAQALLQGPPVPFSLPVEQLRADVAAAARGGGDGAGEQLLGEPSAGAAPSDPGSAAPARAKAPSRFAPQKCARPHPRSPRRPNTCH